METSEPDHRHQGRLLALNAERAADEVARGLAPARATLGAGELEEV